MKKEKCLNKQKQDQDTIVYPDTMTQLCIKIKNNLK